MHLTQTIDKAKSHLDAVPKERTLYCEVCKASREELKSVFMMSGTFQPPAHNSSIPPRNTSIKVDYSFNMAQQVSLQQTYIIVCIKDQKKTLSCLCCYFANIHLSSNKIGKGETD